MTTPTIADLAGLLEQLNGQLAALNARVASLEAAGKPAVPAAPVAAAAPAAAAPVKAAAPAKPAEPEVTEDELLAISAAIAAYLGVKARIRQIRLLSSPAWAQQGRVSIQASHRL